MYEDEYDLDELKVQMKRKAMTKERQRHNKRFVEVFSYIIIVMAFLAAFLLYNFLDFCINKYQDSRYTNKSTAVVEYVVDGKFL